MGNTGKHEYKSYASNYIWLDRFPKIKRLNELHKTRTSCIITNRTVLFLTFRLLLPALVQRPSPVWCSSLLHACMLKSSHFLYYATLGLSRIRAWRWKKYVFFWSLPLCLVLICILCSSPSPGWIVLFPSFNRASDATRTFIYFYFYMLGIRVGQSKLKELFRWRNVW